MQSLEIDQSQQQQQQQQQKQPKQQQTQLSREQLSSSLALQMKPISDPSLLPKKKSEIFGACSNLVNSIVGAGIIGIPFAFAQSGLVSGFILLILVGYFTDKSLRMIINLALSSSKLHDRGVWTYNDLLELPYGRIGRAFVLISMFVTAYGAMVAYLLIIKDTVPVVLGIVNAADTSVGGFVERELVMLITSIVVCVPLSMQRDFSSLAFTSFVSVFADVLLVIFIAIYAPIGESLAANGGLGEVIKNSIFNSGFFIGFGVLTIAMCCQHSAFIVAGSLNNPTPKRWSCVTSISLSTSTVCCMVLGVAGYLGFLYDTQGDVLNNFGVGIEPNVARGLLAITMFFTYPMEAFVARHVLVDLIWDGDIDGYVTDTYLDPDSGQEITTQRKSKLFGLLNRRYQLTFLIYILTLTPALFVDDLGPVLSITGAIGGCCLAYIIPGFAYFGIHGDDFLQRLANCILSMNTGGAKSATEGELPMDGDATAQIDTTAGANNVDPMTLFSSKNYMKGYKKPWWWYPLWIPLWVKIAMKGSTGLNDSLTQMELENHRRQESPTSSSNNDNESGGDNADAGGSDNTNNGDVRAASSPHSLMTTGGGTDTGVIVEPCIIDYGFAMFFIVFGIIALVAGVTSNIYVQVTK